MIYFNLIGEIEDVEVIAKGRGLHESLRLRKTYGGRRWRKLKGRAKVRLKRGRMRVAELHWYEADGVGRKEMKIKRFI